MESKPQLFKIKIILNRKVYDWDLITPTTKHSNSLWLIDTTQIWVNTDSGSGLLAEGTKPLAEPVLIYYQVTIICA